MTSLTSKNLTSRATQGAVPMLKFLDVRGFCGGHDSSGTGLPVDE
jgi:hypothetical protein